MRTLDEFNAELLAVMQQLGPEPSLNAVEAAGRALVRGGVPEGANFEGLILLRDEARARSGTPSSPA